MDKAKVIVIRGVLNYAKVIGKARPHTGQKKFDKGPYWSVDVTPDAKSKELLKEFGIGPRSRKYRELQKPDANRVGDEPFLSLKILENRSDGEKNSPPKVVDIHGKDWNGSLIGNGSVADVKVKIVDYGAGSELGTYLQAIRVLKHVPYEIEAFAPVSEDDEYFAEPESRDENMTDNSEDFDDDDVPA